MISRIDVHGTAAFGDVSQSLVDLRTFNYFFGSNGSGKTTISKILADQSQYPSCRISWKGGLPLEMRVYNRDFVDRNFSSQNNLKGVFTLGEMEANTLQAIETIKQEIDTFTNNLYIKFEGDDKVKCKALCSWVNDGSHSAFDDDYYTTLDDAGVQRYLQVFRQIFEKCDQISHYNMMMGISPEEEVVEEAL